MESNRNWSDRNVLVTGGTGYMGRLLVKKLLERGARRVITYSRRWDASEKLKREIDDGRLFVVNGDVRDKDALSRVFFKYCPDIVIHAAAYKSVPSAEANPSEAISINLTGTMNVVDISREYYTDLCFISTDKACAGINTYGKSKALAEAYVSSMALQEGENYFSVRYGNVVGSTGSVFEIFKKTMDDGRYPVTDPHMTRYWFRENSAAEFVLDSFDRAKGGEVFVPYLSSSSMKQLAEAWREVKGGNIEIVGIRPGEKLHEQMISSDEMDSAVWFDKWNVFAILPHGYEVDGETAVPAWRKIDPSGKEKEFSSFNTRRYSQEELVQLIKEYLKAQ